MYITRIFTQLIHICNTRLLLWIHKKHLRGNFISVPCSHWFKRYRILKVENPNNYTVLRKWDNYRLLHIFFQLIHFCNTTLQFWIQNNHFQGTFYIGNIFTYLQRINVAGLICNGLASAKVLSIYKRGEFSTKYQQRLCLYKCTLTV